MAIEDPKLRAMFEQEVASDRRTAVGMRRSEHDYRLQLGRYHEGGAAYLSAKSVADEKGMVAAFLETRAAIVQAALDGAFAFEAPSLAAHALVEG